MDHRSVIFRVAGLGLLVGVLGMAPALAQQKSAEGAKAPEAQTQNQGPSAGQGRQALAQTQRKLQNLQRELGKLQQKALKDNPDLAKQRQALQDLVVSTMKDKGHTPEKDMQRMQEIRSKLQSKDVEKGQKQKLVQEMRDHQRSLIQARRDAFQDKKVQQKSSEFRDNLIAAMKKSDPDAESLIKEYNQTRQQLQQQVRQLRSQQQQSQPMGKGGNK